MKLKKIESIHQVLCETFPNDKIPNDIGNLKIGDIEHWDSLGNLNLLLAVEERFSIRFTIEEMTNIKSISQLITFLENK
jgi:acyl carrier protein